MAVRRKPGPDQAPLEEYRRKRDFDRTAEPRGDEPVPGAPGRRFVVQKHAARQLHYDFRLEFDGVLKSWAVPRGPSLDPSQRQLAVLVEDHPMEYVAFEGAIPKGEYGGGTVMVWDQGEWDPIGDAVSGFQSGDLKFRLRGQKLRGAWVLARMGGKGNESGRNWLLIKKRDDEARTVASFNVLAEMPRSVLSGRTMEEIAADPEAVWTDGGAQPVEPKKGERTRRGAAARGDTPAEGDPAGPGGLPGARRAALPESLRPQLATPADTAPKGDEWLHEIKLDGYRMICRVEGGKARLFTRNGHDWTDRMPGVAAAAIRLPEVGGLILDGEVVVLDAAGISDFQALQNSFRGYRRADFVYYLFDVPFAGGFDLRKVPLRERKAYLERLVRAAPLAAPAIQYCDHIVGQGPVVLDQAAKAGLEGIVSKRLECPYESRRTDSWRKVKCINREEFVVGGCTPPAGSRNVFGALLLGYHDENGRLVYCGRVGTGFDEEALRSIGKQLEALRRATPPFVNPEADPEPRTAVWVEPTLVAEVDFNGLTDDGLLRQASFRGLRLDKDASEVVRAAPPGAGPRQPPRPASRAVVAAGRPPQDAVVAGVRISHPARTVYPDDGVSKLDVARYYEAVAEWMLPHVAKRPLSLVRCPLGLAGESFYQREVGEGFPEAVRGFTVGEGKAQDHAILVDDLQGLVSLAQMGVLEIHAWGCRADDPGRPDRLIFDLDPGPGILWEHVVESARFVREYLERLGLASFVKTTGGKGLHVVLPLVRRCGWPEAKAFTKAVADAIVRIAPRNFVATMSKAQREQRIFIDSLRNQPGSTAVAAYSTRARNGATVSTPLTWDELSAKLDPRELNVRSVPRRLAHLGGDPWAGFRESRQSITAVIKRAVGLA